MKRSNLAAVLSTGLFAGGGTMVVDLLPGNWITGR